MRRVLMAGVIVPLAVLLAAEAAGTPPDPPGVSRVQDHLSRVVDSMRSAATTHLTAEQLRARKAALAWLEEYRAAGAFPHNHVRPGQRVPVFVDPHGTPCAVGYLMLRSGYHDLVDEITRTDNLIRIHELRDDPRVSAWLDAHGITLDEAALIQPAYDHSPSPPTNPDPVSSRYGPATVGISVTTAVLASYTALRGTDAGTPWVDALSLGTAMGHAYLVLNANDTRADEPGWAVRLNVVGLVASVGSEILRIARRRDPRSPAGEPAAFQAFVAPGRNGLQVGFAIPR